MNRILIGDNREQLTTLPAKCVHCVATSPPYWGLRSYLKADHPDKAKEIGSEQTPEQFIATMVDVFRAVWRVLRDDGVLFVNLGDSYSSEGGSHAGRADNQRGVGAKRTHDADGGDSGRRTPPVGYKPGDLCNMPHRLAMALQADGWFHRDTIIWHKPSPMPSSQNGVRWERHKVKVKGGNRGAEAYRNGSCPDRPQQDHSGKDFAPSADYEHCPGCPKCTPNGGYILRRGRFRTTTSHEYIFMFAKSKGYHCDAEQCKEEVSGNAHSRGDGINPKSVNARSSNSRSNDSFSAAVADLVEQRLPRSIWRIAPEPYKKAHFATFPSLLAKRCIEMATSSAGCCAECGAQYAPVVATERVKTRPGEDTKLALAAGGTFFKDSDKKQRFDANSDIVGNRDPYRHISRTIVSGYRPTCTCPPSDPVPCVVLDPFGGSGRTAQAAQAMGREWILCELNAEYVNQEMIDTLPKWARPKRTRSVPIITESLPILDYLEAIP